MDNVKFQELVLHQLQVLTESNKALTENQRQTQEMVTQLVRIVGNTNAAVEELRAGQVRLESDVAELKAGQVRLESDVAELKAGQVKLETKAGKIDTKLDYISKVQNKQTEILDVLSIRSIHHEAEILAIKRAK